MLGRMCKFSRIGLQWSAISNSSVCTLCLQTECTTSKKFINGGKLSSAGTPNFFQQIRKYGPTMGQLNLCWNCKEVFVKKNKMICDKCGRIQDLDTEINYFELLDYPKTFQIEQHELTKRFRRLQAIVHPDKFSNKTSREQENSANWSSLINKAYETLSAPIERGQYILSLHGLQIPQENSALDKEFLTEIMELNEEVEEAESHDDLFKMSKKISKELNENLGLLRLKFDNENLDEVAALLIKMNYLNSIQNIIKKKTEKLMCS